MPSRLPGHAPAPVLGNDVRDRHPAVDEGRLLLAEVEDAATLALIAQANDHPGNAVIAGPLVSAPRRAGSLGLDQLGVDLVAAAVPDLIGALHRAHAMAIARMPHTNFAERIRATCRRRHQLMLTPIANERTHLHSIRPHTWANPQVRGLHAA